MFLVNFSSAIHINHLFHEVLKVDYVIAVTSISTFLAEDINLYSDSFVFQRRHTS